MAKRKGIPKKTRFEVLKRDSFTCQYCGRSAPSVVLQIDHITPVANNGGNEILNLITSCVDCNAGKGPRNISDDSAITRQKKQLDELQERREQLELMVQWKNEISDLLNLETDAAMYRFQDESGFYLQQSEVTTMYNLVKKYGLHEVIEAISIVISIYCKSDNDGNYSVSSVNKAWISMPGVLRSRQITTEKPWLEDVYHAVNIAKKYLDYCPERNVMVDFIEAAILSGINPSWIKSKAATSRYWSRFTQEVDNGGQ